MESQDRPCRSCPPACLARPPASARLGSLAAPVGHLGCSSRPRLALVGPRQGECSPCGGESFAPPRPC